MEKGKFSPETFLSRMPLFNAMAPDELAIIAAGTTERHVDRGEIIFQRGDPCVGFHLVIYGQVKLALKVTGRPITDQQAGPVTWGVWMRKK